MTVRLKNGGAPCECSIFGRARDNPHFLLAHMYTLRLTDLPSQMLHRVVRCPDLTSFANQMNRKVLYTPITSDCEVNFLDAIHKPTLVLISGVMRYSGCGMRCIMRPPTWLDTLAMDVLRCVWRKDNVS